MLPDYRCQCEDDCRHAPSLAVCAVLHQPRQRSHPGTYVLSDYGNRNLGTCLDAFHRAESRSCPGRLDCWCGPCVPQGGRALMSQPMRLLVRALRSTEWVRVPVPADETAGPGRRDCWYRPCLDCRDSPSINACLYWSEFGPEPRENTKERTGTARLYT